MILYLSSLRNTSLAFCIQETLVQRASQESSPTSQFGSISSSVSVFFMVQPSYLYVTTGKTIALNTQTFVGKVMSVFFNTLLRFVTGFLPRSKHLLISWLQSLSVVILEPPKNKVCYCFHCFPIYLHEMMGPDAMILVF